jgi:predicted dehydrogenase
VDKVVDLSADRRSFVSSLYPDIDVTKNLEDIFNDSRIQAVVIATPVKFHFELSMRALQSGKHVLVEKPMATTVQEIEQIRALTETNNLVAMVGHTFLYNPAVRAVKKIIESGELGDIRYIYSQRVNLGRIRSDVDALWNLAPHDISIVQYWLGEPTPISVKRSGMAYVQPDIEDVSFLNLKYPNNILVNIHVSWLDPRKVRRMTVVGSNKMVVYDDLADEKVIVYDKGIDRMAILGENMDFDSITNNGFNHRFGKARSVKVDWQEPLKVEVDHFAQCIQESAECLTGVSHAEGVVRILQFCNGVSNTY